MKFWRDFFVYWIGESILCTGFIYWIFHPTWAQINLGAHRQIVWVAFAVLYGIIAMYSLLIAESNSARRHFKATREELASVAANRTLRKLTAYAEERHANIASANLQHLTIETYVPSKWRFHDMETKTVWKWQNGAFVEDNTIISS